MTTDEAGKAIIRENNYWEFFDNTTYYHQTCVKKGLAEPNQYLITRWDGWSNWVISGKNLPSPIRFNTKFMAIKMKNFYNSKLASAPNELFPSLDYMKKLEEELRNLLGEEKLLGFTTSNTVNLTPHAMLVIIKQMQSLLELVEPLSIKIPLHVCEVNPSDVEERNT